MPIKSKILTITLLLNICAMDCVESSQQPSGTPSNFKRTDFERILSKIDWGQFARTLELQEEQRILSLVANVINGKPAGVADDPKEDKEAHLFKPKYPEPPSKDKSQKIKIAGGKNIEIIKEIVGEKYKGTLPDQAIDMIEYFAYYKECEAAGIAIQNRLLLHGKPGTGKSYFVEVVAYALQIPYFSFSASFFADKYIGEASRKIRKAFSAAKDLKQPILFFIDEIDAIATARKASTHQENRATLTTLLTELQDLQKEQQIFVIAATNDMESLDKAVLDRFSGAICEIKPLSKEDKAKLIEQLCIEHGIKQYEGYPAALAHILREDHFSNRDLVAIVTTAKLKHFLACKKDASKCSEPMHKYFRKAMDAIGKDAPHRPYWSQKFGSGI